MARAQPHWRAYALCSLAVLVGPTIVAALTGLWVLTAVPVGFLFGFFLQKGDLCGASAFSEVLVLRDARKLWGLWVCIVTSMVGFAVLDALGWVVLNPKPFWWFNYLFGGALFGVGMVLAGGCVSGCLFKAGAGNLNSLVALPGIALGIAAVEHGPLRPLFLRAKHAYCLADPHGAPLTLPSVVPLGYGALSVLFVVATVGVAVVAARRRKPGLGAGGAPSCSLSRALTARNWPPWQAGIAIGLLGAVAYVSSAASGRNYPLGVTHGVLYVQLLLTDSNLGHVYSRETATPPGPGEKKVCWWLTLEVLSLVAGSWVSGRLGGTARLLPKPPDQVVVAFLGGLLLGVGAAFAAGCVIGNILSGLALMSLGNLFFTVVVILSNWATTYVYLMGGLVRSCSS